VGPLFEKLFIFSFSYHFFFTFLPSESFKDPILGCKMSEIIENIEVKIMTNT
jgi:hypothetical protein